MDAKVRRIRLEKCLRNYCRNYYNLDECLDKLEEIIDNPCEAVCFPDDGEKYWDDFGLSTRSFNVLVRQNIHTVSDFKEHVLRTMDEPYRYGRFHLRYMGKVSCDELMQKVPELREFCEAVGI